MACRDDDVFRKGRFAIVKRQAEAVVLPRQRITLTSFTFGTAWRWNQSA